MPEEEVKAEVTEVTEEVVEEKTAEEIMYDTKESDEEKPSEDVESEVVAEEESQEEEASEQEEIAEKEPQELVLELSKDSPLNESDVEHVKELAKENDWSTEKAQEVLEHREDAVTSHVASQQAQLEAQAKEWEKGIMTDAALGGNKFEDSQKVARSPIMDDRFVSPDDRPELINFLDNTGLGNHPVFFRMLHAMGTAMKDASYVQATTPTKSARTAEEIMYGPKAKQQ